MGDRANVFVMELEEWGFGVRGIYFYTHWYGTELLGTVKGVLAKNLNLWHDPAYLARALFQGMVGDDYMWTSGYGISTTMQDNETGRQVIVVDLNKQRLGLAHAPSTSKMPQPLPETWWTFDAFVETSVEDLKESGWR